MDPDKMRGSLGLSGLSVGYAASESFFGYDVVVFDGKDKPDEIMTLDGKPAVLHHGNLSETSPKTLLRYGRLEVLDDESWDLRMLLSKIREGRASLLADLAKNSLIESIFCCQRTGNAVENCDDFAPCWQKCAAFCLADAIASLNGMVPGPLMLDSLRNLATSPANEHISVVTRTVGIERATPVLLERMAKSTAGFSDMVEGNGRSGIILDAYKRLVGNSMISDCYFYLGHVCKENFVRIKGNLERNRDLVHVLRTAFDIEADPNVLRQQADVIRDSCNTLLASR